MLERGDKLLIVHRRLFEKDTPRFFVGEVEAYESGMVKVKGFTFVKDVFSGNFKKKIELRIKIFSMLSGTFLVYQLPNILRLDSVTFHLDDTGGMILTDDGGFSMDVSESGSKHEAQT
ncbi:MAG: hypothetical protein KC563_01070 [Nitrospira sp.]|nr:hypothetical protein [Nitrospira sp.]MCA9465007.1 hypothetical protein [Nitrospira sp.]MCA9474392.1 hypothetical protein [Nitrospira sp.]MCB9709693.1 hypothetical protein [Nitrospiraceae bacterium]MDR4486143.1 hypothetical protein [Nitrospirales bacterium]